MPHPGLTITSWGAQHGYARRDRPALDVIVIPRPTDLGFDFTEVDEDGFPVFGFRPSLRALDDGGPAVYYTGVDAAGFPYADPSGAAPGEEATVSIDEDGFLDFTPLEV